MITEAIGETGGPAGLLSLRERELRLAIERSQRLHVDHVARGDRYRGLRTHLFGDELNSISGGLLRVPS